MNWELRTIKVKDLIEWSGNPRKISREDLDNLKQSFIEFGHARTLTVAPEGKKFVIIGGNQSLKALKELDFKEIQCSVCDREMTEPEKQKLSVFLNHRTKGEGEWDYDILNTWDADLADWGIEQMNFETEIPEAKEDDYEIPAEIETDIVLGDLFEIGEHRLLCGDSTDSDSVAKLMNGEKADLLLTDPPYGIDYGNQLIKGDEFKQKTNKHGWRNFGNPEWDKSKPESGVLQYLCQITDNQIIWGGNYFTDDLPPTMGWLIWDKGQRGFSLADGEMAWTSFNNALRIKEYARALANREEKNHPTQKPIEIINWCFEYADRHSKKAIKLVLDAYLGSGSTMVASHQLNRKCYGMELDPKYCQVIIDRMKKLDPTLVIKKNGKTLK